MVRQNRIHVGIVFLISIIVDLIRGSKLGIHPLLISIIIYIVFIKIKFFRNKNIYQQVIIIILASAIAKFIVNITNYLLLSNSWQTGILSSSIVDGIAWPLVLCIMRKITS